MKLVLRLRRFVGNTRYRTRRFTSGRQSSVDCAAAALANFEDYTKFRDFKRFHIQQAIGFKRKLSERISPRTGEAEPGNGLLHSQCTSWFLSVACDAARLSIAPDSGGRGVLRTGGQRGQDCQDSSPARSVPTIEQIRHVLESMLPRPMSTCAIALLPRRRRQARSMLCALSQVGVEE